MIGFGTGVTMRHIGSVELLLRAALASQHLGALGSEGTDEALVLCEGSETAGACNSEYQRAILCVEAPLL